MVYPTSYGRSWAATFTDWTGLFGNLGEAAWREVVRMAPTANNRSMKNQFLCHWDVVKFRAPNKESWNLDSGRPDVGYTATVRAQCNP